MDSNLKRSIMIENYQDPINKKSVNDDSFIKIHHKSESCIDDIVLYVKIKDDKIIDMYFDGEACVISTSATSIMIKSLIGKSLNEALDVMENYYNMIGEVDYDKQVLGELNVYDEISKQPNRIKCATLPFDTLKKVINIYEENKH